MVKHKIPKKRENVGDNISEESFFRHLSTKYNIDKSEFLKFTNFRDIQYTRIDGIPISILRTPELSGLEVIVKYLRENRKLSYKDIAKFLHRNNKTLAVTYGISKKKKPDAISVGSSEILGIESKEVFIPFKVFENGLSVLESICTYLKSLDYSYADISRMIGKDQRTVWTVCSRAKKKLSLHKGEYGKE